MESLSVCLSDLDPEKMGENGENHFLRNALILRGKKNLRFSAIRQLYVIKLFVKTNVKNSTHRHVTSLSTAPINVERTKARAGDR